MFESVSTTSPTTQADGRCARTAWLRLALILVASAFVPLGTARAAQRPHILFILADDLAWTDLGCYGHPWHATPHLDQLASAGMRFTNAYAAAPICSASRASILTGKTPARLGFEFVTKYGPGRQQRQSSQPLTTPPFTLNLPLWETTIAEHLGPAGYTTAFFGKWHLNAHHQHYLGWSPTHGPRTQGFQHAVEDFGSHPYAFSDRRQARTITTAQQFPVDSMVTQAGRFLKQDHTEPFFLMLSHFYVHTPVRTPCRWLMDKYDNQVPADSPNRQRRIAYAAFVETLDHYVGQVLAALDQSGHTDNTLVLFTSDNGGHPLYAANGPLRGSKWNLYEGGIRVPLIARWPTSISAGMICPIPVIGYDLLPTFAELAGVAKTDLDPGLDGTDLSPVLSGSVTTIDRSLYWHFPYYHPEGGFEASTKEIGIDDFAVSQTRPHSAIRRGSAKLLYFHEDERSERYDLQHDVGESRNLSDQEPAIDAELQNDLLDYLRQVDARFPAQAK